MNTFRREWSRLQSLFWFVPSLIVVGSMLLATALIETSSPEIERALAQWPRLFGSGADGARGMMTTLAGSMISIVGVMFSMILVVLTLASSQYTSRVLWNFMRSRVTQVVFGIFAGIFTYSLIVMRTIRGGDEGAFVPSLAVFFGLVLAVAGVMTLMYFVHHIASSIQASSIIAAAARETIATIDRLFPERLGQGPAESGEDSDPDFVPDGEWYPVPADKSGYIQDVDRGALLHLAAEWNTVVRMDCAIGTFVVEETALASLALPVVPDPALVRQLRRSFTVSRHRTVDQDPGFGIRQIVDIALKALSPGINDVTTAVMCIDYLTAILARLASRQIPSPYRYDGGKLRVISLAPTFADLVAVSFDQIRRCADGNLTLISHMLLAVETLARLTTDPQRQAVLRIQLDAIAILAEAPIGPGHDRDRIADSLTKVRRSLAAQARR